MTTTMPTPTENRTAQEFFDVTVNYLRNQKERSSNEMDGCEYQNSEGNRCAIGIHVPDHLLHLVSGYGGGVINVLRDYLELRTWVTPDMEGFISAEMLAKDLQILHDMIPYRTETTGGLSDRGEMRAKEIANTYDLVYTGPNQ